MKPELIWIAIALPIVVALRRFAVAYGYQGLRKADAIASARKALLYAILITGMILIARSIYLDRCDANCQKHGVRVDA